MSTRLALILSALFFLSSSSSGSEFDDLTKKLDHFDYKVRLKTLDALGDLGGLRVAEVVAKRLDDEDWEVQIRALEILGKLKSEATLEAVARSAVEGDIILVRQAAVRALEQMSLEGTYARILKAVARIRADTPKVRALQAARTLAGPKDLEKLIPFLGSRETAIRAAACHAIGATMNPEALKPLLQMLRDKEIAVRVAAAQALPNVDSLEAIEGIVGLAVTETDPYVLERAARGLRGMDPKKTVPFIAARAQAEKNGSRRARHVELLAAIEIPAAVPALTKFLEDPDPFVRAWAARGLGRAGVPDAANVLDPLVVGDPDETVRRMALDGIVRTVEDKASRLGVLMRAAKKGNTELQVRALVMIKEEGETGVLPELYPFVDAEGWIIPTAAMITIGHLGHKEEIGVLAKRVEDRDWRIRAAALEALGQLRHMDVVPYLIAALSDRNDVVKAAGLLNLQVLAQNAKGLDINFWKKWYEENRDVLDITKRGYREEVPDDEYGKSKYLIQILNRAQIICVLGKYDHAEWVLEHLGITQTVIRPQEILTIGLNPKQLVLINCEGSIGRKEANEYLQWFVHVGGYLMTTDWALQNAVIRAFPGYIDRDSRAKTGNDVVVIEPADVDHPLLEGVFDERTQLMWWLEVIAFPMRVVDPFRTDILVDSIEMLTKKYGSSTMAAAFDYGHGKVQHCISHFFLQEEGLTNRTTAKSRKIFAADNLGISLDQIRTLEAKGFFDGQINEAMTKEIAEDYSMFRLIVNFVMAKRKQVEQD
jgi:HEAT repeat protein